MNEPANPAVHRDGWAAERWRPLAVLIASIPLAALALASSLWFPGRVFPGFFVLANRLVPTVGLYSWTGLEAGVPFHSRVLAVDGRPVETQAEVYAYAAALPEHTPVRYTLEKDGKRFDVDVRTMRFRAWDYGFTFGLYLLNGLLVLGAGIAVSLLQPRRTDARSFLVLGWFFGLLLLTAPPLYHPAFSWITPVNLLAQAAWPASMIHLGLAFPLRPFAARRRLWLRLPYVIAAGLSIACWYGFYREPPTFFPVYVTFDYVALGLAALGALLVGAYWRDPRPVARARLRAVIPGFFLATTVSFVGFVNNSGSGGTFPINLSILFPAFFYAGIAYAILQHDLFEIDRLLKQTTVYTTLTVGITAAYAASLLVLGWFPSSHVVQSSPVFNIAFVVLVAFAFEPLRLRVQSLVDRLFFRAEVDYLRTVGEVSSALTSVLDLDEILARVAATLHAGFSPSSLDVLLCLGSTARLWRLQGPGRLATTDLSADGFLGYLAEGPRHAWTVPGPSETSTAGTDLRNAVGALGAWAVVPLARGDRVIGAFLLGEKRSGLPYGASDLELLDTLAAQCAVAIQNALLFGELGQVNSELEQLNKHLEEKVRTRTAELEVSNTELTRAYRELQSTQAQLLQTEKLASLGQLVAGVAHEINTPVTAVIGNVQPLSRELELLRDRANVHADVVLERIADRMKAIFEVMARGAERTARIVQDLRVFSRVEETRPLPMDLHEGIDVSLRLLRPAWADRIVIRREYGELPPVDVSGQINQVFMNLLANACDAIEGRGEIAIRTTCDGSRVRVTVQDDGCGIPAEILSRIFDPFFTTKAVGKGTGLGLAISASIVREHQGTIHVESRPGWGAAFTVELPVKAAARTGLPGKDPATAAESGPAPTRRRIVS